MADSSRSSRRAFVLGGTAAACVTPLAVAQLAPRETPSRGDAPAPSAARSEVAEWQGLVGASFLIAGEAGKALARLAAIESPAFDPARPAELARARPFTAWFEMEPRLAPEGQCTCRVTRPTGEAIELFLSRGSDKDGKAIVQALFN